MPDKIFVVIELTASGGYKSIIGVFADKDDAERCKSEGTLRFVQEAPYNP